MDTRGTVGLLAACAAAFAATAGTSDGTLLRMGPMGVAPTVDGRISPEEARASSTHYGAVSTATGLLTKRYAAFQFGYTSEGFYFATRTSLPEEPQQLVADDAMTLSLLPPGAAKQLSFRVCLADGTGNLPKGAACAVKRLDGVADYGVTCVEAELFVPFAAAGVAAPKDGETWGLQMSVDFSSARETALWHYSKNGGEMGTFIPDRKCPVPGLVDFFKLEQYRQSGNYKFAFRFDNRTEADVKLGSKTVLHRGVGLAKLDSNPETDVDVNHVVFADFRKEIAPAGKLKEIVHKEWVIWPGTVNILDVDLSADGKPFLRRKLRWDVANGLSWKDDTGLPFIKCSFLPSAGNRLRVRYDFNKVKGVARAGLRVSGVRSGKTVFERELDAKVKGGLVDERLPNLPEDLYRVRFAVEDASGGKYVHDKEFEVAKFPWQDAHVGEDRVVVPPYSPIRVDGDKTLFLQTGYRSSGVLWDEVYALGENILAAPVELLLNGRPMRAASSRVVSAEKDCVVREVVAEGGGLLLIATQTYDYDGFCWVKFAFRAAKPVEVKSLQVVMPLRDEIVSLFEVLRRDDKRAGPAPDFSLGRGEGEVWDSAQHAESKGWLSNMPAMIQPYIWFGGPFKGFCWLMESVRGLSLDKAVPAERIVRRDGAATLFCDLVNKPVEWSGETVLEMGFQPTPTRPKDPAHGAFASLMYRYSCPSNAVRYQQGFSFAVSEIHAPFGTYPGNDKSLMKWTRSQPKIDRAAFHAKLDEYIARNADWFAKSTVTSAIDYRTDNVNSDRAMGIDLATCYLNPMLITCFWPEWKMYKSEWYPEEWAPENYFNEYMANTAKTRIDKLLWDASTALDNGAGGIYYDCFRSCGGWNLTNPSVFIRPDGTVQPALTNVRAWREIMKRTATLCYLRGRLYNGRPVVDNHDTNGHVVPVMSFAMGGLSTERSSNGGDFQDRFPEGYTLAEITGGQTGKASRFIVSTKKGDVARQERELKSLMGFMCAYGVFALNDQLILRRDWFEKAWNMVFDFGWGRPGVEQHFYWDGKPQPVSHNGRDVRLTVAKKPGSALLMFGNLGDAAEFSFDVSGLALGDVRLVDAETGATLEKPTLRIDRHGYRIVKVERKGTMP